MSATDRPSRRLQSPRDFSVGIPASDRRGFVGSGFRVTADGGIITCVHVLTKGLGLEPRVGVELDVYLPGARSTSGHFATARIAAVLADYGDDVVLLQLVDEQAVPAEKVAVLGAAEPSFHQAFRSFGFRELQKVFAAPAEGEIQEGVLFVNERDWSFAPFLLTSQQIKAGMSGSPVLAKEHNLVVGVVFATWDKDDGPDRDTAFAVDAAVLGEPPFDLEVRDEPLVLPEVSSSGRDILPRRPRERGPTVRFDGVPEPPNEWVGRRALVKDLIADWDDPEKRVIGLVGFGGEGKSTLARRLVEELASGGAERPPEGVFWWTFAGPDVEEFFEHAIAFVGSNARELRSAGARAQHVVAALAANRYLFVLDGLELVQYEDGERYGLCRNEDLAAFLALVADMAGPSRCLVTSRADVVDLLRYRSYEQHDVTGLLTRDGRDLLRGLGVRGADEQVDRVVERFSGHALTLTLVGAYLAAMYKGKVERIDELTKPARDVRFEGLRLVLERYDARLTEDERSFLFLLSALRRPIDANDLGRLFTPAIGARNGVLVPTLDDAALTRVTSRLIEYRILRPVETRDATRYALHPLVGAHYYAGLTSDDERARAVHRHLARFYLEATPPSDIIPSLEELAPVIEAVHHACRAGDYEAGYRHYIDFIDRGRGMLVYQLGAYATDLALALEFFPNGAPSNEPLLADRAAQEYLVRSIGLGLMTVGRLYEAFPLCRRSYQMAMAAGDPLAGSRAAQLLAELHIHVGQRAEGVESAVDARRRACEVKDADESNWEHACSLAYEAWCHHLGGAREAAAERFAEADRIQRERSNHQPCLVDLWGIYHADHLRLTGNTESARRITAYNLEHAQSEGLPELVSQCRRLLGDLALVESGADAAAREHYEASVKIARGISHRAVLIEALLGRGRHAGLDGDLEAAQGDLDEALSYAHDGGYRIYEADARNSLAEAYARRGAMIAARDEAQIASGLSAALGYHWGAEKAKQLQLELDDTG
jgi:tetratricopeptide (TPR) repeat protein